MIDNLPDALGAAGSCFSKSTYETEELAKSVALKCWRKRKVCLRAYACEVCAKWHLTREGAAPVMKAGWRFPKKSQRELARQRKAKQRRR